MYCQNTGTASSSITFDSINNIPNGKIYKDICTYYEYIQFKRAYFDCDSDNVKYNNKTGRIIEMTFNYNPNKIE